MNVCTIKVKPAELHEGSIVVGGAGRALYLRRYLGWSMGYERWTYTTHEPDGSVTGNGTAEFREGSLVPVVAVTLDGALVAP